MNGSYCKQTVFIIRYYGGHNKLCANNTFETVLSSAGQDDNVVSIFEHVHPSNRIPRKEILIEVSLLK